MGVEKAPRETENNAYAKFWDDKQRVLWYVMVFSGEVNYLTHARSHITRAVAAMNSCFASA